MIFQSVTLNNLGPFKGEHKISIDIDNKNKPIVLIGGLNGAGKTTLLTSLQLALYGNLCEQVSSSRSYNSFLKDLINDTALDVEEDFGISLDIEFDGFPVQGSLNISRSWKKNTKGFKESFEVKDNDKLLSQEQLDDIRDNWTEIMLRILSPELSDLFFFDGEKIIKLADEKTSAELFKESISTLLGLDLVSQLNRDIKNLTSDIAKSEDTELREELMEKEKISDSLSKEISRLSNQIEKIDISINRNLSEINSIEDKFKLKNSSKFDIHQLKKEEINLLESQISESKQRLLMMMYKEIPLSLVQQRLEVIEALTEEDVRRKEAKSALEIMHERENIILGWMKEENLEESSIKLSKKMKKWNEGLEKEASGDLKYSDNREVLEKIGNLIKSRLPRSLKETREIKDHLRRLENKLNQLSKDLEKLPNEEDLKEIQLKLSRLEGKKIAFDKEKEKLIKDLNTKRFLLEKNESGINLVKDKILASQIGLGDEIRVGKHLLKAENVLKNFKKELTRSNVSRLEKEISSRLRKLLRKDSLINHCKIDFEQMTLSLFNKNNKEVKSNRLSAGERQILAVSILWAISRSVDHSLPIIIDTPLARLDSEHRNSLIFDYFPKASDQVILLSTDEEITSSHSKELESMTSHQFLVEANEEAGTSKFRVGYF